MTWEEVFEQCPHLKSELFRLENNELKKTFIFRIIKGMHNKLGNLNDAVAELNNKACDLASTLQKAPTVELAEEKEKVDAQLAKLLNEEIVALLKFSKHLRKASELINEGVEIDGNLKVDDAVIKGLSA